MSSVRAPDHRDKHNRRKDLLQPQKKSKSSKKTMTPLKMMKISTLTYLISLRFKKEIRLRSRSGRTRSSMSSLTSRKPLTSSTSLLPARHQIAKRTHRKSKRQMQRISKMRATMIMRRKMMKPKSSSRKSVLQPPIRSNPRPSPKETKMLRQLKRVRMVSRSLYCQRKLARIRA